MSSLAHHGVKGQKWGVRRYQDKSGRRTALGRMRLEKDTTIKAGTNLNRVTGNAHEINQGYVYMSIISADHDIYKQEAAGGIQDRKTGELITKIYDTRHTVTKDIHVPSFSNAIKAFEKVMESQNVDKIANEVGNAYGSDHEKHANEFKNNYLNRDKASNREDAYYNFVTSLGNSESNRKLLFDELKANGYDAIWDENDRYEGWMKTPLIIFERGEHTNQISAELLKHSAFLSHHGVKGQKWGVRRYQNPDGTRTAEGKRQLKASRLKRTNEDVRDIYKSLSDQKQFDDATKQVLSKTSTNVKSITKEPADIHGVMDRARCSEKDARTCIKLADRIYEKAASVEPQITQDIIGIVNKSNSSMYGLEHRLKQPTSMAGKIGSDSKSDGVSFVEAANGIKDAVRYTTVSDNKSFVSDYRQLKSGLESKGYEEVKCKNFFEKYRAGEVQHKAVQTTFKSPTGYEFELQFQTPESQAAKDLKIPIYEERRKQGISSSRAKELEKQMHDLAERVPYPDGIETIESHNKVKHSSIGGNMNYIYGNTLVLGDSSYLEHHGIKNQKWGVRRFQNPDGSLTAAGRIRYGVTGAAKAAFKVGKKLGSATASAAKAGVKKAKDNAYAKKKAKVSQTREGVLKNKKMFTADELKALENRFKIEDEMSEASLRHGQAVAKTVSQYANTTRDVLSALQTGGNAVSAITKAFADIQSYQNAKGVAEAAKEKGMTTKEFDLFLKAKYPNAKKDDGSKKKDKNSNKAQHSDSDDDNDDNNPPNDGGGGLGAKKAAATNGPKEQTKYDYSRRQAQDELNAKRKAALDRQEEYIKAHQDALVKVSKQRQSEQDARDEDLNRRDEDLNRRDKAASEREEKLKSTAKDAAEVMNKLKERKNNLDRREADLNNIADALDSEIGYRIDTISELRKTLHDDDDSSKKKKNAKHSAMGEEMYADYLEHFGVHGMKWGVRRFQNKDGSLTEAGKQRYANTGNLNSGGGGGGGAPEEEDEETKKKIEEAAKKAGMTVDEYRKKFADKVAALKEKARDAAWDARYAAEDAADAVTGKTSKQIAEKSAKSAEENEKKAKAARKEGRYEDAAKYEEWAKQSREISEYRQGKYEKSLAGRYDRAKSSIAKRIPGRKAVGASSVGKSLTANGTVTAKLVKIKKKSTVNSRKDTSWKYDSSISTKDMRRMAKDSSKFTESVSKKAHEAARAQNSALRAGNKKRANTNSWAATQYNTLAKDEQTGGRYSVKNVKRNYDNTLEGKATKLKYATQRTKQRVYNAAKRKKKSASHAAFIEDGTLYLEHHGIKGQKWGLRRFQNPDGTRTEAGKKRDAKIAAKAAKYRNKDISRYDLEIAKAKDPDQKYRYEQLKKHTEKLSDKEIIAQQKHSRAVAAGEGIVATVAVSLGLGMPNIGSIAIGAAVAESIAKTTRDNYRVRSINAERMQESVHKEYENLINHSAFIEDGTLYLAHHGILGQKWGVRRFQDAAGRLTAAGKKRIKDAKSKLGNAGAKYKATSVENTESVVAPGGGAADDWDDFDEETLDIYIQNMLSLSDEDLALLGLKRSDLENAKSKDDKYKIVLALKKYDNPTAKGKRVLNSLMNAMFSSNLLATLSPVTLTGGALWAKMREAAAERRKAREPVDPKTGLHLKQEWDKAPEFDVVNVNPGFTNLSDNTKNNCMLCTTAYDLRRRGYDVNAERISQGLDYNDVKRYYPDAEVRNITNASTTKELNKKTRAALISQGEGARGNLMVQWQGGAGGHSMAYEVHDGDVKIYDAQTGAVKSTEDVIQYTVSVSYARLDNVEPDWDRIKEAVR